MRTSFVVMLLCGVALAAGVLGRLSSGSAPSASSPSTGVLPETEAALSAIGYDSMEEPAEPTPAADAESGQASFPTSPPGEPSLESPAVPPAAPTPFSRALDILVSADAGFQEKQSAWTQLREAGQLDEAVEALKQGAAENPTSAAHRAALGQAQLQKAGEVSREGGAISEMGILGMEADRNFDAALRLDPDNWEAQFFKATAMSYWPLELNKGEEVIQRLSSLIDQQDTLLPQPEFAQTYVVLGDQYQKMGRPGYAVATWQIGSQRFPGNPALQQRVQMR